MSEKILAAENYMNDVISVICSNWKRAIKRREEMSVWGPVKMPASDKNNFTVCESSPAMLESNSVNADALITVNKTSSSEENCVSINKKLVKNSDNYQESEVISNRFRNRTMDLHEIVNPVNYNKKQLYIADKTSGMKNEFLNWCENRWKEYESRSNLNQPGVSIPVTKTSTEVQEVTPEAFLPWQCGENCRADTSTGVQKDILNKNSFSKKNENEDVLLGLKSVTEDGNNISPCKKDVFVQDNSTDINKTNFPDSKTKFKMEKSLSVSKEIATNEQKDTINETDVHCSKFHDPLHQKLSKVEDKILKNDCILKNNQFSFEIFQNMSLKENHHLDIRPKSQLVEKQNKIVNTKKKLCETYVFTTEKGDVNEHKKKREKRKEFFKCSQNKLYEQSSRFMCSTIEENDRFKKHPMSKTFLTNKLFSRCSKEEVCRKMNGNSTHDSSSAFKSRSNSCSSDGENILSIKISDENYEKNFEVMANSDVISRIKRTLPRLAADIPEVDSGCKKINYSADAMNILLRLVFCQSFKIVEVRAIVGVEVLAAAESWNVKNNFLKKFEENFFKNILTSKNASTVFAHANYYNLKDVCNACKDVSVSNAIQNSTTFKKKQKTCLVSISTYIEPLEICIPFEPAELNVSTSFLRQIKNTFTFKSISGCYSITGFQIQLNEDHIIKKAGKADDRSMLTIDYDFKNLNGNKEMTFTGSEKKPLRSVNIIYFSRSLIIKPKEVGEIYISAEIEPYWCSAHKEKKLLIENSGNKLELTMESKLKIENSDRNIFLATKFFYHVTKVPKN